ncbi:MAG: hypothetical protein II839_05810, partial [Kiritimatiellae bacterium]|nr:hypothetical protein [Kiritimatiellia bacterium]
DAPDMTGAGGDLRDESGDDPAERRRKRKENERKGDIVLDEALRVLADLADLHGAPPALSSGGAPAAAPDDFLRSLLP